MLNRRQIVRAAILGSQNVAATGVFTAVGLGYCVQSVVKNTKDKQYKLAAINLVAAPAVSVIMGLAGGIAFARVNRG